jgi:hypothetical protein
MTLKINVYPITVFIQYRFFFLTYVYKTSSLIVIFPHQYPTHQIIQLSLTMLISIEIRIPSTVLENIELCA